jgi:hypothetical protein
VTRRLAVAASAAYPELRDDWPLLRAALATRGIEASTVVWNDPAVDWAGFDLVLANGAWDYIHHLDQFVAWTDRVGAQTRLVNPADALQWNADKHYLHDLARLGVPIVPTVFVDRPGDPADPGRPVALPAGAFVIKPTVSGGAFQSARYDHESEQAEARAHLDHLLASGRDAMIQPYQAAVDSTGETGLIFVEGQISHAIHKEALLRPGVGATEGLAEQMVITLDTAAPHQLEMAGQVLEAATSLVGPLTYARVDLVPDDAGTPMLMELEILDPALFFELHPAGVERLAAVLDRASTS